MFDQENHWLERQSKKMELGPRGPGRMDNPYVGYVTSGYNWEQVLRVLRKNLRFVCGFAIVASALVAFFAFHIKDKYQPVARIEIDPQGSEALSPRETESSFEYNQEYLETQLQILQSDELALRVIRALHLDRNPKIVDEKSLARYGGATQGTLAATASHTPLESSERTPLEDAALLVFHDNLRVGMVRGSRLVELSYVSPDRHLAQQITNTMVAQFIDQNFKTRYQ
jgi:succinoglycan biosynthesis transport protein ExoP